MISTLLHLVLNAFARDCVNARGGNHVDGSASRASSRQRYLLEPTFTSRPRTPTTETHTRPRGSPRFRASTAITGVHLLLPPSPSWRESAKSPWFASRGPARNSPRSFSGRPVDSKAWALPTGHLLTTLVLPHLEDPGGKSVRSTLRRCRASVVSRIRRVRKIGAV